MSLKIAQPPKRVMRILGEGFGGLLRNRHTNTRVRLSRAPGDEVSIALPHPVYFLGTDYLITGRVLSGAVFSGWRFIIMRGGKPLLSASLAFDVRNNRFEFLNVSESPFARSMITALRRAAKLKVVMKDDFEIRLLDIPGLELVSLWLHGKTIDYLLPLPPAGILRPFNLYSESALADAVHASALKSREISEARA
jgi:hypothetical protein